MLEHFEEIDKEAMLAVIGGSGLTGISRVERIGAIYP